MGTQMYSRFVDDISIKIWVARDKVDDIVREVKLDWNSWHACIKVDPVTHIATDPLGGNDPAVRSDFLFVSESYVIVSSCVRIETSVFRKMPGYMHAPFSSALPSAVKLGTVISQRIRYIAICSTERVKALRRWWWSQPTVEFTRGLTPPQPPPAPLVRQLDCDVRCAGKLCLFCHIWVM